MSEAPQTADTPHAERHLPGEEGIWVFIFGDMTIFAVLFATYLHYRSLEPKLFNASQEALNGTYGVINTLFLLTSSLFVAVGVRAVRARLTNLAPWMFVGAFCCGLGFLSMKTLEYSDKISHHITPATDHFFMYFYVLTGLHLFHLVIGMAVLCFLFFKSRAPQLSAKQLGVVEGGACFWHMVDLLWIVLFPLLYFVR